MILEPLSNIFEHDEERSKPNPREYLGVSKIGEACERKIWYMLNEPIEKKQSLESKLKTNIGKSIEYELIHLLKSCDFELIDNEQETCVSSNKIKGYIDGLIIIDGEIMILEIKSCSNASFNKLKNTKFANWVGRYYYQVQIYMGLKDLNKCIVLVVNRETGDVYEELVLFDQADFDYILKRYEKITSSTNEPARINNNKCFYVCQSCEYKEVCYE